MQVRLSLFGAPSIDRGGQSLALPFERRTQLLAFLALRRSWVGRAELAPLLWPDQDHKLALTNLRKALHRLQSMPGAEAVEAQGNALRFAVRTDVHDFEEALREQHVAEALSWRRGELLTGFDDDPNDTWSSWLSFERDRLRLAWRSAAQQHLSGELDPPEGIDLAARLVEDDPLDDSALRTYMDWLARGGQGARARQAYREFATRLSDELGLTPSAELMAFHDAIGAGGAVIPAAARRVPTIPSDGFVGRTVEIRRIAALLSQDDCRLLCVIGPGGMGKTRLARRAIDELAQEFADGARFVALEDIESADELGGRLARELELALKGSAEPLAQVIGFLRARRMLLVLDNFEHLAPEASVLDRLLEACPKLKILVTSRVRLALAAEWLLPLEGLPYPDEEDQEHIETFDAVRLFVRAAQRVQPLLTPGSEAAAIADICRQVEGLPLALELAAAWTRVLPCDAIAAELRQGTELLHAVDATHPARHASLKVVFDNSWRLLAASERDALSQLSVFRGGFSVEAARAVAAAPLPVLAALVDKSLLRRDGVRNTQHPLLHQLGAERLTGDDRTSTEAAHARYFHRWMAQLAGSARSGDRAVLRQLELEFENVRAAWQWAIANGQTAALMGSAQTLFQFCVHRGRFEECLFLLRDATECHFLHLEPRFKPLLMSLAAHLEYQLNRYADAEATATRALAAARETRDHEAELQCVKVLGACCLMLGRFDAARRHYRRALRQTDANTHPNNAAAMLDNLALIEIETGNLDEALRMSMVSLIQHRGLADVGGEALCLNNIGSLYISKGDLEVASVHLNEGLALCERHGLVGTQGVILANLTEVAVKTGDPAFAQTQAERALEVAVRTANRSNETHIRIQVARIAIKRNDVRDARRQLQAALELAVAVGRPSLLLDGVFCFAEILLLQGEPDAARRLLVFAAEHSSTSNQTRDEIHQRLMQLPSAKESKSMVAGPLPELDELVHRIVVETPLAHAALLSALRGEQRKNSVGVESAR